MTARVLEVPQQCLAQSEASPSGVSGDHSEPTCFESPSFLREQIDLD